MRQRTQEAFTKDQLERMYYEPWAFAEISRDGSGRYTHDDLRNCPDYEVYWHLQQAFGLGFGKVSSMADLSCGDARVPKFIAEHSNIVPILGDYAPGYEYRGTLTETVPKIPNVELFVCTNTLEHLDDPDADLRLIREKCDVAFFSASVEDPFGLGDHYWKWDREGVETMLSDAGFTTSAYCEFDGTMFWYPPCKFGMWAVR